MDRVICPACGGEYDMVDRHGTHYFHACPPLSVPELKAAIAAQTFIPSNATRDRLEAAAKADQAAPPADDAASRVDQVLESLVVVRPNHRDETDPDCVEARRAPIDVEGDYVETREP